MEPLVCGLCHLTPVNLRQHLLVGHMVANRQELKLLLMYSGGRTTDRLECELCGERDLVRLDRHLADAHSAVELEEREAITLRAKRASIVRELAALRSTKPEPPMVSYLDMGILQPLDVIQEESEESEESEEEDQDQASPRASRGAGEGKPGSPDPAGLTGPRMTSTPVHGSPRGLAAPCSGCQALTERLLLLERKVDFLSSCSFRHTESLCADFRHFHLAKDDQEKPWQATSRGLPRYKSPSPPYPPPPSPHSLSPPTHSPENTPAPPYSM